MVAPALQLLLAAVALKPALCRTSCLGVPGAAQVVCYMTANTTVVTAMPHDVCYSMLKAYKPIGLCVVWLEGWLTQPGSSRPPSGQWQAVAGPPVGHCLGVVGSDTAGC